jgi:hypothetical protein
MNTPLVTSWLQSYKDFRERRNKNKWLGALIMKRHGIELTPLMKSKMDDIVSDILSADRMWRDILDKNESLRGSDFSDGKRLSQEWQMQNGYDVGYHTDVRKLETLA